MLCHQPEPTPPCRGLWPSGRTSGTRRGLTCRLALPFCQDRGWSSAWLILAQLSNLGLSPYDSATALPPVLHHLQLRNVGPTPQLELALAPRLNLITGDNGLGKSFLLDAAWYCLTRCWPQEINPKLISGAMALPRLRGETAELAFRVDGAQQEQKTYSCSFNLEEQA